MMSLFLDCCLLGFVIVTAIQLLIWVCLFGRLARFKVEERIVEEGEPVSIVICARNEEDNLKKHLKLILEQKYHLYEVVVVNDQSTDATKQILEEYKKQYDHLKVIDIIDKPKGSGKKPALARGIQSTKYEKLLFTDADCYPTSEYWLLNMQSYLKENIQVGLGFGPYEKGQGFLNLFVRYETFFTALQYLSLALAGHPYMGVGRNLIYQKKLFDQVDGFSSHEHIMSGDDDLFINQVANSDNTAIILNKDTFMYSEPVKTWKAYHRQKSRHVSTGKHYRLKHQFLLGLVSFSHFFHYFFGFFLIILKFSMIFAVSLIITRILVIILVCKPILRKLRDPRLTLWTPVLDAVYVLFYVIFSISLIKGKIKQWT